MFGWGRNSDVEIGGKVYFGEFRKDGVKFSFIKIGRTKNDPVDRLKRYAKQHGYDYSGGRYAFFELSVTEQAGMEKALHNSFERYRVNKTEVFSISFTKAMNEAKRLTGKDPQQGVVS